MYFWGVPTDWLEEAQTAKLRLLYAPLMLVVMFSGWFNLQNAPMWIGFAVMVVQIILNAYGLPRRAAWIPNLNFFVHRVLLVLLLAASGGVNGPFVVVAYISLVSSLVWYSTRQSAVVNVTSYLIVIWLSSLLAVQLSFHVGLDYVVMHTLGVSIIAWLMSTPIHRLSHHANTDALTGVLNRRSGTDSLEAWISANRNFSLIFVDLKGFKTINDTHGHATGDAALVWVANALRGHVRDADLVIRYGGDEFLIAMSGHPEALIRRLETVFSVGMTVPSGHLQIHANFGVAQFPEDGPRLETLLSVADRRMYDHKHGSRDLVSATS
jgi:diguanylate cyclase (GGDEF)-like protein